ncbi:MAG: hypothetical protein H6594_05695 [Flavobacteriales bacterium]|nr:hypothetical protein [Flavobacteriales bacterium]
MPTGADTLTITAQQRSALRTLVYFDLFHHPLRPEEVVRFADSSMSDDRILGDLVEQQLVRSIDGYLLMNNNTGMLDQRRTDEVRAQARMGKARRMSRLIGAFPFVRGVLLSGSMSKGRLASDGDIDYFVITRPGRLWIARTLLVLFKKVFLLNSRRYFCVNYFVDEDHLTIEDRNRFTATELVTLIPTNGKAACAAFFAANDWGL